MFASLQIDLRLRWGLDQNVALKWTITQEPITFAMTNFKLTFQNPTSGC